MIDAKIWMRVAACAAVFGGTLAAETLQSGALAVDFGEAADGYAIRAVRNRLAGDARFVDAPATGASFWEATFWKAGDAKAAVKLNNLSPCRAKRMVKGVCGGATFIWDGLDLPGEKGTVTVRAQLRFTADGQSKWSLEVQNQSGAYGLAETRYPILRRVTKSGEADVLQPRPDTGARLVRNRPWGPRGFGGGCMGYMPMMTAFIKGEAGLYIAAHDSSARIKSFSCSKEHDYSFVTPVENAGLPGAAAEGPRYEVTVAAFKGDWWQAARLYRGWALNTKWTAKGRILDRADYPKRLAEIPLWLNIHGLPADVSNVMTRARAVFPKVDCGIHWHVWQHSKHDINYPEYFPEQEGTRECIAYCHSIGEEPMPYTNGRLWSTNLLSYAYVTPYAMKDPEGRPYVEKYGPRTPPMTPMCPYTRKWDETLNDFSRRILDLGAGSLFLDQIGACAGHVCHAHDHGHPVGGGAWYFEGYQRILAKTHAAYAQKGAFLTTEGSGETWMNVVDGYLNVTQRQPDDVPFFHAVYNGYTTYFCSPENQDDDRVSFRAAQTRELLWGQSLGWYHPLILDKADKCELLNRLAAFRQAHLDCLAYGTLLGEVKFDEAVGTVKLAWLGRKPFWAWAFPDWPLSPTVSGEMPAVLGYVWQSATTGRKSVFLANLTDEARTVRFVFEGQTKTVELAPGALEAQDGE